MLDGFNNTYSGTNGNYIFMVKSVRMTLMKLPEGGCRDREKRHINLDGFTTWEQRSSNNNCFFKAIQEELGWEKITKGRCNKIRKTYGLSKNAKIDILTANKILEDCSLDVEILDIHNSAVFGKGKKRLMLYKNHYQIVEGEFKQYFCEQCGKSWVKTHDKKACINRQSFRNHLFNKENRILNPRTNKTKENKYKNVLHYDIECYKEHGTHGKDVAFCVGFCYYDSDQLIYDYFAGKDCMEKLYDFIMGNENIKYNVQAKWTLFISFKS